MHVNEVEALWFSVNLATFILTAAALWDAIAARRVVKALNGHAREIAAGRDVRREALRLLVQTLLLIAVIPGLSVNDETELTLPIAALIAVPIVLLANSIADTIDRRRLIGTVAADMLAANTQTLERIEAKVDDAAAIVSEDRKDIADALVADALVVVRIEATVDDTAAKVKDIHDVTVEKA